MKGGTIVVENDINVLDFDKINLSLKSSQNNIAVTAGNMFSLDKIEKIDLGKLICPSDPRARSTCGGMKYKIEFDDGSSFETDCTIDLMVVPSEHYFSIYFRKTHYDIQFKCNPNVNNSIYLSVILAKAANYIQYKNIEDRTYNFSHIVMNFSSCLQRDIPSIWILRKMQTELTELQKSIDGSRIFDKTENEYDYKEYKFKLTPHDVGLYKFTYYNIKTNISRYCYFRRNIIGIDAMVLAFNHAISKIAFTLLNDEGL